MTAARNWQDIIDTPREQMHLLEAALAVAKEEYPQLDVAAYVERIDAMAATFRKRLRADITPTEKLKLLNHYLFDELGYAANTDDFHDPRNSFLNEVLERKLGIPITLSLLYIEVGRRAGLPLHGVSFPGHFLVKCALHTGVVVLDPYAKGVSLGIKDLQKRLRILSNGEVTPETVMRLLTAATPAEIIVRMLRNLKVIYAERGDTARTLSAINRVVDLCPDNAEPYRDRARLLEGMACFRAALLDFEKYLKLNPQADDAQRVREKICLLSEQASRLN